MKNTFVLARCLFALICNHARIGTPEFFFRGDDVQQENYPNHNSVQLSLYERVLQIN